MKRPTFSDALIPIILGAGFIVLDLVADRLGGHLSEIDLPHVMLAVLVLLISYAMMRRLLEAHRRSEAALRQARDDLEIRVRERTAELEQKNEALRESEEKFATVFRLSPDAIGLIRASDDMMLDVNEAFAAQVGCERSEIIGKTWDELNLVQARAQRDILADLFAREGKVSDLEFDFATRAGHVVTLLITLRAVAILGERCMLALAHDITERKRAEETLRTAQLQAETEKRHLEAVLQSLPVGVVITNAQGGVLLTNGMDEQIWGSRPTTRGVDDYVQYQAWWADSGKPVEPHEWASAQAVEKGESVFGQVLEIRHFDGGRGFILNSAVPIRDGEGRVIGSAVAIQDITELRRAEQALRESEERFRMVINNSRDGINMLDLQTGRYVFMSPAQVVLTGFSAEELRDLSAEEAFERVHPDDREISISQQKEITAGRIQGSTVEYRWKVKSGEYRWFSDSRTVVRDEQGRAVALVGVSRDITDQKLAQDALRASEEKYRLLFQNMVDGFALYELLYDERGEPADWRILEVNDAYTLHTGIAREQIVGRCISELVPGVISEYLPRFSAVVATQTPSEFETYARAVGRHQRVITFPAGGRRFANIIEDITERKRSEERLRQAQTELTLGLQERAALEERQRLARELHDSVSQAFYGISLGANTALTLFDKDRAKVLDALYYVLSLAHSGLVEMRALIFELRPESLEMEGLVVALTKQTAAMQARHGVDVDLNLCDEPDVPLRVKEALYRITQEALQNAIKHARPERLDVRLACAPDSLTLEVCDNGVGFDPLAGYPGHLGLRSMRERAMKVGGTLEIVSAADCGTQVRATIPIPVAQAA